MDDPALEPIERQLAINRLPGAPGKLRGTVLAGVHRQLAAQRWDRRLGRAAVLMLVVGVGLNAAIGWRNGQPVSSQAGTGFKPDAITQAAVAVAEATDAETGTQIARHLAALGGVALSPQQEAAIQQQIESHFKRGGAQRKEG
jgi:hypothetical protein